MQSATPHHRHQSSLEGIIDFSKKPPLTQAQHQSASHCFRQIVDYFDNLPGDSSSSEDEYDRVKLVRFTFEYARSEESQGNFLRAFFESANLSLDEDSIDLSDVDRRASLQDSINNFADYLFDNFFLPLKASTRKTPQPSPASHSAIQRAQGEEQAFLGTPERLSALRGLCLLRDRHRCVVSRRFDEPEGIRRINTARRRGGVPYDDDGVPLRGAGFDRLEVAHILPHSLTRVNASNRLDPAKEAALAILNMFDSGVAYLIEGAEIDRPRNAVTLTHRIHAWFGEFQMFFEPVDQEPHTYRIRTFLPQEIHENLLPVTRALFLTESRTIDPPSPRLLAVHNAIAHILHLSAAGEYIDKILRDWEDCTVQADGSTELDHLVKLRLGGWSVGVAQ